MPPVTLEKEREGGRDRLLCYCVELLDYVSDDEGIARVEIDRIAHEFSISLRSELFSGADVTQFRIPARSCNEGLWRLFLICVIKTGYHNLRSFCVESCADLEPALTSTQIPQRLLM